MLSLVVFFGAIVAWVTDHVPEGDRLCPAAAVRGVDGADRVWAHWWAHCSRRQCVPVGHTSSCPGQDVPHKPTSFTAGPFARHSLTVPSAAFCDPLATLRTGQSRPTSFPMTLATNPLRAAGLSKRARMRVRTAPRTPALAAAVKVWEWAALTSTVVTSRVA